MFPSTSNDSQHLDNIHDVKYDSYGSRMATCSSDQFIKVWELTKDNKWHCSAKLQGHVGTVWRIAWAHPAFGQVIASCGFDGTIAIWEENMNSQATSGTSNWVRRAQLVDARKSVTDIKFAPKHLGMQLASCSTDGVIRLYEAQDIMDLGRWRLQYNFPSTITASCLSWSTSSAHDPMLAIGNCKPKGGNSPPVLIYELSEGQRKWERIEALTTVEGPVHDVAFAPYMGQSYHTFAVAADRLYVFYIRGKLGGAAQLAPGNTPSKYKFEMACGLEGAAGKIWRVCWNVSGTILTSSGEDGNIRFWTRDHLYHWNQCKVFNRNYLCLPCQQCCQGTNDGPINRISSGQMDPRNSPTRVPPGSSFA